MTGLAYYHSSDDVQMKPVPEWLPVSVGLQTRHIVNSAGDVEGGGGEDECRRRLLALDLSANAGQEEEEDQQWRMHAI